MVFFKRKIWKRTAFVLLGLFTILFAFTYGYLCFGLKLPPHSFILRIAEGASHNTVIRDFLFSLRDRKPRDDGMTGRWLPMKGHPATEDLTDEQREAIAELEGLGYADGYEKPKGFINVTTYNPLMAADGYNLYTSAHACEAVLINMAGKVVHRWSYKLEDAFPDYEMKFTRGFGGDSWRRVYLYENGDLLALYVGVGLIKLDKDSKPIWTFSCASHHDLFVDQDGIIYLLTRKGKIIPRILELEPVLEDFITVIGPDGTIIKEISVLKAFEQSAYASFLDDPATHADLLHTNTIEILDGSFANRSPLFKKGNALISCRKIDVIAIVDMDDGKVVWGLSGQWRAQHDPIMLDNGNILLLDNHGHNGMSKVIELDPFSQKIIWAYMGTPENGFYTDACGTNQRLSNGNTLITESDSGRAFEVTPENQIVWEFYNPARAGEENELIATLFDVIRIESSSPLSWMNNNADK